jgi:hypothetical protein
MSAQRAVPSEAPRPPLRQLIAALVVGAALGAAIVLLGARSTENRIALRLQSPDRAHVGIVYERPCSRGRCQELRIGANDASAKTVESLTGQSCDQITWTPDGKRVAFVIDGKAVQMYDPQSLKLAGTVGLLSDEAAQTRVARGITFSENGRALTFDDCPRAHSGCRAGVVGVPQ